VAAGSQVNGVSIDINGSTPDNKLNVLNVPIGVTAFAGTPPGDVIFNGGGQVNDALMQSAINQVMLNPFIGNMSPFLDDKGSIMGGSYTPMYTLKFAFLLDQDDWLKFLKETVVWENDQDECTDL